MTTTLMSGFLLLLAATSSFHLVDSSPNSGDRGQDYNPDQYPNCGGKYQSPVDIELQSTVYASEYAGLKFLGYDLAPEFEVSNFHHTVVVRLMSHVNSVGISGSGLPADYFVHHFHFHWGTKNRIGAEHTIYGHAYPMELHLVHYNQKYENFTESEVANKTEGLAVLGVFIEVGGDTNNTDFGKLVDRFEEIKREGKHVNLTDTFPMESLLPSNKDYYRYSGSLTTGPCFETVTWTVFKNPITISKYQMKAFRKLAKITPGMQNNFRPTKPLNGRTIYRSYEEADTTTTSYTTTTTGARIFPCSTLLYTTIFIYAAAVVMAI